MMIDFAIERRRDEQLSPADAIHEACMVRFRPIMMTTVVGGLLVSQTLTLYVTPVFYVYMEKLQERLQTQPAAK